MKHVVYLRKPLGNKRFLWKQKDYVLSTFNCIGENMDMAIQNCVDAGFNLLELGWGRHDKVWEAVEVCEKYGIDLIFQDLSILGGMMKLHVDRAVKDETIRQVASTLKAKTHTVGYFVWDEPYCEEMFAAARRQSDILHECDPEALLFSVFPPSYNSGPTWDNGQYYEAFEEYIQRMEPPVVSMDHYPVGDYWGLYPGLAYTEEAQLDNAVLWCDLAVARDLARKYDLPFWFYYQGCPLYEYTKKFEFSMVRGMMYAAALYGAKGLQNYTATGGIWLPSDGKAFETQATVLLATGEKGTFFAQQKQIHTEFRNLGNTLMALTNQAVYHSDELMPFGKYAEIYQRFADNIKDSQILNGELPPRTSVGQFTDDYGNYYLFVQNRDFYKALHAEIPLRGRYHLYEVSKEDGKQRLVAQGTDRLQIALAGGDAILLRIQPGEEAPFTVEYRL